MEISEYVGIDVSVTFLELVPLLLIKITLSFPVFCSVKCLYITVSVILSYKGS